MPSHGSNDDIGISTRQSNERCIARLMFGERGNLTPFRAQQQIPFPMTPGSLDPQPLQVCPRSKWHRLSGHAQSRAAHVSDATDACSANAP